MPSAARAVAAARTLQFLRGSWIHRTEEAVARLNGTKIFSAERPRIVRDKNREVAEDAKDRATMIVCCLDLFN
jgi:hypothetical protein